MPFIFFSLQVCSPSRKVSVVPWYLFKVTELVMGIATLTNQPFEENTLEQKSWADLVQRTLTQYSDITPPPPPPQSLFGARAPWASGRAGTPGQRPSGLCWPGTRSTGSPQKHTRLRGTGGTRGRQDIMTPGVTGGYEFPSLREEEMGGRGLQSPREN